MSSRGLLVRLGHATLFQEELRVVYDIKSSRRHSEPRIEMMGIRPFPKRADVIAEGTLSQYNRLRNRLSVSAKKPFREENFSFFDDLPNSWHYSCFSTLRGSVANSRGLAELLILGGNAGLCGEDGELPGEGRIWIEGESRLSFAHHVNHFDAG
jgi:hypothetical protein